MKPVSTPFFIKTKQSLPQLLSLNALDPIFVINKDPRKHSDLALAENAIKIIEQRYATTSPIKVCSAYKAYIPYKATASRRNQEQLRKFIFRDYKSPVLSTPVTKICAEKFCGRAIVSRDNTPSLRYATKKAIDSLTRVHNVKTAKSSPQNRKEDFTEGVTAARKSSVNVTNPTRPQRIKDVKWRLIKERTRCWVDYKTQTGRHDRRGSLGNEDRNELESKEEEDKRIRILRRRNHGMLNLNREAFDYYKNVLRSSMRRIKSYLQLSHN